MRRRQQPPEGRWRARNEIEHQDRHVLCAGLSEPVGDRHCAGGRLHPCDLSKRIAHRGCRQLVVLRSRRSGLARGEDDRSHFNRDGSAGAPADPHTRHGRQSACSRLTAGASSGTRQPRGRHIAHTHPLIRFRLHARALAVHRARHSPMGVFTPRLSSPGRARTWRDRRTL